MKQRPNKRQEHNNVAPVPRGFPAIEPSHEGSTFGDGYYHQNSLRDPTKFGYTVANMGREEHGSSLVAQTPRSIAAAPSLVYKQRDEESEVHFNNSWLQQPVSARAHGDKQPSTQAPTVTGAVSVEPPMTCGPSHGLQAGHELHSDLPLKTCDLPH